MEFTIGGVFAAIFIVFMWWTATRVKKSMLDQGGGLSSLLK